MRNYGIRYPYVDPDTPEDNYGAWVPDSEIETFIDEDNGKHFHELIPKDYVPKNQRMED